MQDTIARQVHQVVLPGQHRGQTNQAKPGVRENPDDPANKWGVNSAQTAYILLRLPFRILIHADLMLPH